MIITNKQNLPEAFVGAVEREQHNMAGCYSATTLLKGVKETILTARHWDELETDAADSVWSVFGQAVHLIFERQKDESFKEESFAVPVNNSVVTGRVDSYDLKREVIVDWKTASVWKIKMHDFADWYRQGLIYAWLLKKSGLNVKKCRFIALLKDFSKTKAKTESDYPASPVYIYEFAVTDEELKSIEHFITSRIEKLEKAEVTPDDEIEECTYEERWADYSYAVMVPNKKRALRVFPTRKEAEKCAGVNSDYYIEERHTDRKCEDYCPCAEFCHFYRNEVKNAKD